MIIKNLDHVDVFFIDQDGQEHKIEGVKGIETEMENGRVLSMSYQVDDEKNYLSPALEKHFRSVKKT